MADMSGTAAEGARKRLRRDLFILGAVMLALAASGWTGETFSLMLYSLGGFAELYVIVAGIQAARARHRGL